jgi:hypothetical protein
MQTQVGPVKLPSLRQAKINLSGHVIVVLASLSIHTITVELMVSAMVIRYKKLFSLMLEH